MSDPFGENSHFILHTEIYFYSYISYETQLEKLIHSLILKLALSNKLLLRYRNLANLAIFYFKGFGPFEQEWSIIIIIYYIKYK